MKPYIYDSFSPLFLPVPNTLTGKQSAMGGTWEYLSLYQNPFSFQLIGGINGTNGTNMCMAYNTAAVPAGSLMTSSFYVANTTYGKANIWGNLTINETGGFSGYYAMLDAPARLVTLERYVNGTASRVGQYATGALTNAQTYTIGLEIRSGMQIVTFNGRVVIMGRDTVLPVEDYAYTAIGGNDTIFIRNFAVNERLPGVDTAHWDETFTGTSGTAITTLGFEHTTGNAAISLPNQAVIGTSGRLTFNVSANSGAVSETQWTKDTGTMDHFIECDVYSTLPSGFWPVRARISAPWRYIGIMRSGTSLGICEVNGGGEDALVWATAPTYPFRLRLEVIGDRVFAYTGAVGGLPTTPLGSASGYQLTVPNPALLTATRTGFGAHLNTAGANIADNYRSGPIGEVLPSSDTRPIGVYTAYSRTTSYPSAVSFRGDVLGSGYTWSEDFENGNLTNEKHWQQGSGKYFIGPSATVGPSGSLGSRFRSSYLGGMINLANGSWTMVGGATRTAVADRMFPDAGEQAPFELVFPSRNDAAQISLSGATGTRTASMWVYASDGPAQFRIEAFSSSSTPPWRSSQIFHLAPGQMERLKLTYGFNNSSGTTVVQIRAVSACTMRIWGLQVESGASASNYVSPSPTTMGANKSAAAYRYTTSPDHYVEADMYDTISQMEIHPLAVRVKGGGDYIGAGFPSLNGGTNIRHNATIIANIPTRPEFPFRMRLSAKGNRVFLFTGPVGVMEPFAPYGDPEGYVIDGYYPEVLTAQNTGFGMRSLSSTTYDTNAANISDNYTSGPLRSTGETEDFINVFKARSTTRADATDRLDISWAEYFDAPSGTALVDIGYTAYTDGDPRAAVVSSTGKLEFLAGPAGEALWVRDGVSEHMAIEVDVAPGFNENYYMAVLKAASHREFIGVRRLSNSLIMERVVDGVKTELARGGIATLPQRYRFEIVGNRFYAYRVNGSTLNSVTGLNGFNFTITPGIAASRSAGVGAMTGAAEITALDNVAVYALPPVPSTVSVSKARSATRADLPVVDGTKIFTPVKGRSATRTEMVGDLKTAWTEDFNVSGNTPLPALGFRFDSSEYGGGDGNVAVASPNGMLTYLSATNSTSVWTKPTFSIHHYVEADFKRAIPDTMFPIVVRAKTAEHFIGVRTVGNRVEVVTRYAGSTTVITGGNVIYPCRVRLEMRGDKIRLSYKTTGNFVSLGVMDVKIPSTVPDLMLSDRTGVGRLGSDYVADFADNYASGIIDVESEVTPTDARSPTRTEMPFVTEGARPQKVRSASRTQEMVVENVVYEIEAERARSGTTSDEATLGVSLKRTRSHSRADIAAVTLLVDEITVIPARSEIRTSDPAILAWTPVDAVRARSATLERVNGLVVEMDVLPSRARSSTRNRLPVVEGSLPIPARDARSSTRAEFAPIIPEKRITALEPRSRTRQDDAPVIPEKKLTPSKAHSITRADASWATITYELFIDDARSTTRGNGIEFPLEIYAIGARARSDTRADEGVIPVSARALPARSQTRADEAEITIFVDAEPARSETRVDEGDITIIVEPEFAYSPTRSDEGDITIIIEPDFARSETRSDEGEITVIIEPDFARSETRTDLVELTPVFEPARTRSETHSDDAEIVIHFLPDTGRSETRTDAFELLPVIEIDLARSETRTDDVLASATVFLDVFGARSDTGVGGELSVRLIHMDGIMGDGTPPCPLIMRTGDNEVAMGPVRLTSGYPHYPRERHSVAIYASNFYGRVVIQASLKSEPNNNDWVTVYETEFTGSGSKSKGTTFNGRYASVRAFVYNDRIDQGFIDRIMLA